MRASLTIPFPPSLRMTFIPGGEEVRGVFSPYIEAVVAERRAQGLPVSGGEISIDSDLPQARGFSSSAALCVTTARVLAQAAGESPTHEEIAELAFRAERHRVGVMCGRLDPLACAYGEPLLMAWADADPVRVVDVGAELFVVAGVFPTPRDTAGILATLNAESPAEIGRWGALAFAGAKVLEAGEPQRLGMLMNEAQAVYETLAERLEVLHAPGLVGACKAMRDAGALGAKFSGAGGDGSVVGLASSSQHAAELSSTLTALGLNCWGLRVTTSSS